MVNITAERSIKGIVHDGNTLRNVTIPTGQYRTDGIAPVQVRGGTIRQWIKLVGLDGQVYLANPNSLWH